MRFPKPFSIVLSALLLAGCASGSNEKSDAKKEVASSKAPATVEGLISTGCDKYLAADSKGAKEDFATLAELDSTYKEIETANEDIAVTMKGVTTVQAISDLPEKDRQRVYESILTMENLCAGVDAP
jgi:PBP1b-binding outer membrane lipoprotein LpoB